jgi:hypothetical protein
MAKSATREPDSSAYVLLDVNVAAPVKVPVVAFAAVTAAVPVCLSRRVLFRAFEVVVRRVAALVRAVVDEVRGFVVDVVKGLVVVIRITGSVSDLLVDVVTRAFMVVVLTLDVVREVCEALSAYFSKFNVQACDLVRLTVFTRVEVMSSVMALAVVVTVARVASFVTVDVKG